MADLSYKVVLLGESNVGKEQYIFRLKESKYGSNPEILITSSNFIKKTLKFKDGKSISLDIFDTAGKEEYRSLANIDIKDARVVILVYDITNEKSFTELKEYWYEQVKKIGRKDVIFAVAANKYELYEQMRVENEKGKEFAKSIGAGFFLTSSKSDSGFNKMLEYIGKKLIDPNYYYDEDEEKKKEREEYERMKKEKAKLKEERKTEKKEENKQCIIF